MTNKEHCEIEEIRIGNSKETLDPLSDHNSVLLDVISVFGHFIKYFVKCHSISNKKSLVNAFDILVQSQAEHNSVNFPPLLIVKNNDIRSLIQSKELCWKADEVHGGTARKTLQALCDALWCIDGSHSTLSERSCEIPEVFQKFNGYNQPQSHKHRKRQVNSPSRDVLLAHSQSLFAVLQCSFWNRSGWIELKPSAEHLARSLARYADQLLAKRIRIQNIHESNEVIRDIGQNKKHAVYKGSCVPSTLPGTSLQSHRNSRS